MNKIKVGLIFGGSSSEHEVSLQSAQNIVNAIDRSKYDIMLIGIDKQGEWNVYEESSYLVNADDPKHIQLKNSIQSIAVVPGKVKSQLKDANNADYLEQLDVVFPILHGGIGEDGSLQGLMRIVNLPFVGPNVLGSSICMDKDITKRLLKESGINVAKGFSFTRVKQGKIDFDDLKNQLGLPMFVKPASQGSSVGVSKVSSLAEFEEAVKSAFEYDNKILIEESVEGREIECAVLGNEYPKSSIPGEIISQSDFYSYESKYIDETGAEIKIPAEVSEDMVELIKNKAVEVFNVLECEGLARVDFFLKKNGDIYVNEVNTLPGFTKISMYPKLWEISGVAYSELINQLIELALERHQRDKSLKKAVN